jgi:hypothetical protein
MELIRKYRRHFLLLIPPCALIAMIGYGARGEWINLLWPLNASMLAIALWSVSDDTSKAQTQLDDPTEQAGG